ncbi:helix-turn-helix domain-containing protein [Actinomadura kijaniata]|uniref:helix-turn-helix domain-containing protein n=1 Tax=Actinomadura kijaniata TaxID=46161 RepID=UPI003F1B7280
MRQDSAGSPASTASNPVSSISCITTFLAASSPATGRAIRSGSPGAPRSSKVEPLTPPPLRWRYSAIVKFMDLVELGRRLRAERQSRGFTLEALAAGSEVSRSMISEIERGAKAPTVLVLARLATALGTTAARLLEESSTERIIVLRHQQQPAITDVGGWERRVLSPSLPGVEFEFIRTSVPAGVTVGEFAAHAPGSREYAAVEQGELTVTIDGVDHTLQVGDAIYYAGDTVHAFANKGEVECVYYTAMHVPTKELP